MVTKHIRMAHQPLDDVTPQPSEIPEAVTEPARPAKPSELEHLSATRSGNIWYWKHLSGPLATSDIGSSYKAYQKQLPLHVHFNSCRAFSPPPHFFDVSPGAMQLYLVSWVRRELLWISGRPAPNVSACTVLKVCNYLPPQGFFKRKLGILRFHPLSRFRERSLEFCLCVGARLYHLWQHLAINISCLSMPTLFSTAPLHAGHRYLRRKDGQLLKPILGIFSRQLIGLRDFPCLGFCSSFTFMVTTVKMFFRTRNFALDVYLPFFLISSHRTPGTLLLKLARFPFGSTACPLLINSLL